MSGNHEEHCNACVSYRQECIWPWDGGKDPVWSVPGTGKSVPPMGRYSFCALWKFHGELIISRLVDGKKELMEEVGGLEQELEKE